MITGRLILVRHGETEGNVARRLDTKLPGSPLTEDGVAQAHELGERLHWEKPVGIFSSAALRARQTAEHALSTMDLDISHTVLEGLHEVQAGDLEDRSDHEAHHTFHSIYTQWHIGLLDQQIPGGESGRQVLDRLVPVIEKLRTEHLLRGEQTIVVIAHGAAIRLVAAHLASIPPQFALASHLRNTQSIELGAVADGSWHCLRWGSLLPPFGSEAESAEDPMG